MGESVSRRTAQQAAVHATPSSPVKTAPIDDQSELAVSKSASLGGHRSSEPEIQTTRKILTGCLESVVGPKDEHEALAYKTGGIQVSSIARSSSISSFDLEGVHIMNAQSQQQQHSPPRQHIHCSPTHHHHHRHQHHHRLHHHHHRHHNSSTGSSNRILGKKQKKPRRFSYSQVGPVLSWTSPSNQSEHSLSERIHNGSLGYLIDPTPKCCNIRPPILAVSTNESAEITKQLQQDGSQPTSSTSIRRGSCSNPVVMQCMSPQSILVTTSPSASTAPSLHTPTLRGNKRVQREEGPALQLDHGHSHPSPSIQGGSSHRQQNPRSQKEHEEHAWPRVCKMVLKHPAVKLDWKVPEPIKAGSETLRGVLVISARELRESGMKAVAGSARGVALGSANAESNRTIMKNAVNSLKFLKRDPTVRIEHIEIDLIGVEEVTTGSGLLSRTRTDRHCFLHKTQVLAVKDMKLIQGSIPSPSALSSSSIVSPVTSIPSSTTVSVSSTASCINSADSGVSRKELVPPNALAHLSTSAMAAQESFQSGCIAPGTQQGIPFQIQIPGKVGGTFKSTRASIGYQLTANVHIRRGKEVFVLQHHLPVCLFELVQIRAAIKIASPHDLNPATTVTGTSPSLSSTTSSSPSSTSTSTSTSNEGRRASGVRFVIPKSNSVLGTAEVKPYSLWGLGPTTSSPSQIYNHHNYYRYAGNGHGYSYLQDQEHRGSPISSAASASRPSYSASDASPEPDLHHREDIKQCSTMIAGKKAQLQTDEILSAGDQHRRLRRQQQREDQQQQKDSDRRYSPHRDSQDGIDEVGFGAHIDKSVAAAGDNITLGMFVVKSDGMKVIDIKVSLVETIQIFSLLDDDQGGREAPQLASTKDGAGKTRQDVPRRRLVETHVAKIAKDYVPAQAEESHANDNHLKGYYEDYEDFRSAKSLSVYKLGMHIPETALTVLDRDLFKVEYMFVIKFFFKGRMGAFLELPIEIISQYNHNRISTNSGAISCVSNSVQIALPPVPILVKRSESFSSDLAVVTTKRATANEAQAEAAGSDSRRSGNQDTRPVDCSKAAEDKANAHNSSPTPTSYSQETPRTPSLETQIRQVENSVPPAMKVSGQGVISREYCTTDSLACAEVKECQRHVPAKSVQSQADDSRNQSDEPIRASCDVPRAEFEVIGRNDIVGKEEHSHVATKADDKEGHPNCDDSLSSTPERHNAGSSDTVPKIVIDSVMSVLSPSDKQVPSGASPKTATSLESSLPLLFDLTSAALPTSTSLQSSPVPAMSANSNIFRGRSISDSSAALIAIKGSSTFAATETQATDGIGQHQHLYERLNQRQNTIASRNEESTQSHSGLVAKIAKSLSSPVLRSRANSASSPDGSTTTLSTSPHQLSSTFTLAATTLPALTLLSSVGHAAVGHEINCNNTGVFNKQRQKMQQSPPKPLRSCLKKRSVTPPPEHNSSTASMKSDGECSLTASQGSINKKKVTFAKGSTPLPSPSGSQVSLAGLASADVPSACDLKIVDNSQRYDTTLLCAGVPMANSNDVEQSKPIISTQTGVLSRISCSPTIRSPNSASPRTRVHHPFDSHPSRLSPLEKQHLDSQIQDLNLSRDQKSSNGEVDAEDSEVEEDDDEDEEHEDNFEDEDDDEKETDDQRIERRRLARIAWLAKYGDAFKQVYGAVPELPPI